MNSESQTTNTCGRDGCGKDLICCRPDCPLVAINVGLGLTHIMTRAAFVSGLQTGSNQTIEVEAYREKIIAWLKRKEEKWRETVSRSTGAANEAASFYAAAYSNVTQGVLDGDPEKRAAMEKRADIRPERPAANHLFRTDKDFAIEFGGYLADEAERFMRHHNSQNNLTAEEADEGMERWSALSSAIYEFRKRAERTKT